MIPGTQLLTLKLEGVIDVPLLNLLTLIYEIELWDQWVPFLNKPFEVNFFPCINLKLKKIDRAATVVHTDFKFPFPLAQRTANLYGIGVNRLKENGTILIIAQSIDEVSYIFIILCFRNQILLKDIN